MLFRSLLAGETEEQVFPEELPEAPAEPPAAEPKLRPQPKPRPLPFPGATMQPPPPEGAKS